MIDRKGDAQNWFENNFTAVPGGIVGNCSACVFRNAPVYCAKMSCTYFDRDGDYIETVYWRANEMHANLATWPELRNWFCTTPPRKIMDISQNVARAAVLNKMQQSR